MWHALSYRDNAGRTASRSEPAETEHLTQRTWTRVGGIYTFGAPSDAFLNAGIAEDTDALSSFRMGGGLRLRAEFPLMLHGYNIEEVFARRFWLVNFAYRFPVWPDQDRVHLQLLADYARVDYVRGHRLPRTGLAGVGANLSVALTKSLTLVVGYGYGVKRHAAIASAGMTSTRRSSSSTRPSPRRPRVDASPAGRGGARIQCDGQARGADTRSSLKLEGRPRSK